MDIEDRFKVYPPPEEKDEKVEILRKQMEEIAKRIANYCPSCAALRARIEVLERFLADNADYDGMKEKDQEWFIENVHKKYYPENY